MRRAALLPAAALSVAALLALPALVRPGPARGQTADSDAVALARAFTAAWNAHDAETVVALFWPDATVRQTGAVVLVADDRDGTPATALVEDAFGAGRRRPAEAPDGRDARAWSGGEVLASLLAIRRRRGRSG